MLNLITSIVLGLTLIFQFCVMKLLYDLGNGFLAVAVFLMIIPVIILLSINIVLAF